jgi:hypothetical protein
VDNGHVAGATTASLTVHSVTTTDVGTYRCVVTDAAGSVYSSVASLTIDTPPSITTQPHNVLGCAGATAQFSVVATNATSYVWEKSVDGGASWIAAAGSNNQATYTTPTISPTDFGAMFHAKVLNGGCIVVSSAATLSVSTIGADFNLDCHVDDIDLAHLLDCQTGPALGPPGADCANADIDEDDDVDVDDFALLQRCLTGPSLPVDLACQG